MKRSNYDTAGRRALSDFLMRNPDRQYSAEELYAELSRHSRVGKSSLYRLLNELCEGEVVRKFSSEQKRCSEYQYIGNGCDCRDHFHQKCLDCGKIQHLDCRISAAFTEHLFLEHGFTVNCGQSILYGVCADCAGREEQKNG